MKSACCGFVFAMSFLVGCTVAHETSGDAAPGAPGADGQGGAPAATPAPSADPGPGASPPGAAPPPPPAGPVVETILADASGILDFDLYGAGIVVLRASPSQVDACNAGACAPLVATGSMPTEVASTETFGNSRANASLAVVGSTLLVGQSGKNTCAMGCTSDDPTLAGLYAIDLAAPAPAARVGSTIPLVFAKARRFTNGWLVGRSGVLAVDQYANNESADNPSTTIFTATTPDVSAARFSRGGLTAGGYHVQPFLFAAAATPEGQGGYATANGDFIDVDASTTTGLVPIDAVATATTGVADVFVRTSASADGSVITFSSSSPATQTTTTFPGITPAERLVASATHLAYYDPAATGVTLHACSVTSVLAGTCAPAAIALPVDAIVRVRASGSSLYVLGTVGAGATIVKLTIPS